MCVNSVQAPHPVDVANDRLPRTVPISRKAQNQEAVLREIRQGLQTRSGNLHSPPVRSKPFRNAYEVSLGKEVKPAWYTTSAVLFPLGFTTSIPLTTSLFTAELTYVPTITKTTTTARKKTEKTNNTYFHLFCGQSFM